LTFTRRSNSKQPNRQKEEKYCNEILPFTWEEFEEKLTTDENFRNNPKARLDFFYERSPYPDKQLNIYPILRIEK